MDREPLSNEPGGSSIPHAAGMGSGQPQRVESSTLLGGRRELVIVHGAREYRLRVTQHGKLILTA